MAVSEPRMKSLEAVAQRYIADEIPERFATRKAYLCNLRNHILPRWGNYELIMIQPAEVEAWLKGLRFSPKTKVHLRNLLRILVDSAMRRGWLQVGQKPNRTGAGQRGGKTKAPPTRTFIARVLCAFEPHHTGTNSDDGDPGHVSGATVERIVRLEVV